MKAKEIDQNKKIIEKILAEGKGILKTADVISAGITKNDFYRYVREAGLEKAAHGIYLAPTAWADEMYLLQVQIPKAIYSHETALYLHDLAEMEPVPLTVTVPSKYNSRMLIEKGVNIVYVKNEWYPMGISNAATPGGHQVAVYDMERTVCDILRKKEKMDAYTFNHALREYMKRRDKDLSRLMRYAKMMHLENKLREVMGVLF